MTIYGPDYVNDYHGREIFERPPHIFAIADAAYKSVKRNAVDTCIVISGKWFCMCLKKILLYVFNLIGSSVHQYVIYI